MIRHKIVLLPFPFDDLSSTKVRPAVCLTEKIGPHQHIIVAFVTSRIPTDILDTDLVIDANHPEFASSGLKVSSTLRLHRLMTINASLIKRELGTFPKILLPEIRGRLMRLFSLSES